MRNRCHHIVLLFVVMLLCIAGLQVHAQTTVTNRGVTISVRAGTTMLVNGNYTNDSGFTYSPGCTCNGFVKNEGSFYTNSISGVAKNHVFDTLSAGKVFLFGQAPTTVTGNIVPVAFSKLVINKPLASDIVSVPQSIIIRDTLFITKGNLTVGNTLTLHPSAQITGENDSNKVSGLIRVTRYFPSAISITDNMNGTGIRLRTAASPGTIQLQRFSVPELNAGNGSIRKSFDLKPGTNTTIDSLVLSWFHSDTTGTGNVNESRLKVFGSYNNGLQYTNFGGAADVPNQRVLRGDTLPFKDIRLTLADDSCKNAPAIALSDSIKICSGDTAVIDAGNSGSRFLWSTSDTTQTVRLNTSGMYWVKVTDNKGCSSKDSVHLIVNPKPLAAFSVPVLTCRSTLVTLTNTSSIANGSLTYQWDFGDTTFSLLQSPGKVFGNARNYQVKLIATSNNACKDSFTTTLTVHDKPLATFNFNDSVCQGTQTSFTNLTTVTGSTLTYSWNFGNSTTSTVASPVLTYAASGNYNVKMIATSGQGCVDSASGVARVFALPVSILPDTGATCGDSLILDAGNAGMSYAWSTSESTQTVVAHSNGWYKVVITSPKGCFINDSIYVKLHSTIKPNLGPDTIVCGGIMLDANISLVKYLWSTSDTTKTVQVKTNGTYFVKVTDANNCVDYDTAIVTVHQLPAVNLGNDTAICANDSFSIVAGDQSRLYLWYNGATDTAQVINASGPIWVRVTDGNNCVSFDTLNAVVYNMPVVKLPNDSTICPGNSVVLNASNPGSSYLWADNSTGQTDTLNSAGSTWVKVTDTHNCIASDTFNLSMHTAPVVNIGNDTSVCQGVTVVLNAGNSGARYAWSTSDTTQQVQVTTAGTYHVTVTDANGCSNNDTVNVGIKNLPTLSLGNDTSGCDSILITAVSSASQLLWSSSATAASVMISSTGTYSVAATSTGGCQSFDTIAVTINASPVVNLGADGGICFNSSRVLNAGNSGSSYLWSTGDTTQTINASTAGTFWTRVTTTSGCVNRDSVTITVNPLPVVNLGNDTAVCSPLLLQAGNAGSTFAWSTGDTAQQVTIARSGPVWVQVTNAAQCKAYDTINVTYSTVVQVNIGKDTSICSGDSVKLSATPGNYTYLWSTSDTSRTIWVNTSGNYSVIVTEPLGCSSRDTMQLTVNPLPFVDLGADEIFCRKTTHLLDAGNAGSTFKWYNEGVQISTAPFIYALQAGEFRVVVTNTYGCSSADTIRMIATPPITAQFLSASNIEEMDSVQFIDLSYPTNLPLTFWWEFGDGDTSNNGNPIHVFKTAATYMVKLIVSNGVCSDTLYKPIIVKPKRKIAENPVLLRVAPADIVSFGSSPNPTVDGWARIFVELSREADAWLQVFDLAGKLLLSQPLPNITKYEAMYDLGHLQAGTYLVQVNTGTKKRTWRLVKL